MCITVRRSIPGLPGASRRIVERVGGRGVGRSRRLRARHRLRRVGAYTGKLLRIYGIRTSHGLVPADGVVPLAASFDTVGWFARSASLMRRVGTVLLPGARPFVPRRLLIATDAFAAVDPAIDAALTSAVETVAASIAQTVRVNVYTGDPAQWRTIFRVLQGADIHAQHAAWIDRYRPEFGLPQISLPLGTFDGCPLGLSIIGPRGCDQGMLDWAAIHFA
jgi:Asp-tRNA(Asn)/Glu-tRNA(Gln) amidotransferase A subunit family amidase